MSFLILLKTWASLFWIWLIRWSALLFLFLRKLKKLVLMNFLPTLIVFFLLRIRRKLWKLVVLFFYTLIFSFITTLISSFNATFISSVISVCSMRVIHVIFNKIFMMWLLTSLFSTFLLYMVDMSLYQLEELFMILLSHFHQIGRNLETPKVIWARIII